MKEVLQSTDNMNSSNLLEIFVELEAVPNHLAEESHSAGKTVRPSPSGWRVPQSPFLSLFLFVLFFVLLFKCNSLATTKTTTKLNMIQTVLTGTRTMLVVCGVHCASTLQQPQHNAQPIMEARIKNTAVTPLMADRATTLLRTKPEKQPETGFTFFFFSKVSDIISVRRQAQTGEWHDEVLTSCVAWTNNFLLESIESEPNDVADIPLIVDWVSRRDPGENDFDLTITVEETFRCTASFDWWWSCASKRLFNRYCKIKIVPSSVSTANSESIDTAEHLKLKRCVKPP